MRIVIRIIEILTLLFLIFWLITVVVNFINTKNNNEPRFCLKTNLYDYDDGVVHECIGMGYKVITYERDEINGVDFVPFWEKPKENIE